MAKREKKKADNPGVPEYMVTFGDMMALLLTFFIMLFSMSQITPDVRFRTVLEAIQREFGYARSAEITPGPNEKARNSMLTKIAALGRARIKNTVNGGVKIRSAKGDQPQMPTGPHVPGINFIEIDFAKGGITLDKKAKRELDDFSKEQRGHFSMLEIVGFTTKQPIEEVTSQFRDHDELASARCQAVKRYLINEEGIYADRLYYSVRGVNRSELDNFTIDANPASVRIYTIETLVEDFGDSG